MPVKKLYVPLSDLRLESADSFGAIHLDVPAELAAAAGPPGAVPVARVAARTVGGPGNRCLAAAPEEHPPGSTGKWFSAFQVREATVGSLAIIEMSKLGSA